MRLPFEDLTISYPNHSDALAEFEEVHKLLKMAFHKVLESDLSPDVVAMYQDLLNKCSNLRDTLNNAVEADKLQGGRK